MHLRRSFRRPVLVVCAVAGLLAPRTVLRAHSTNPALFPAMIEAFTAEIAKAPETELFVQRGEVYMHMRDWAKAEVDFAAAAKGDPQRLSIVFLWARALLETRQPAKALPLVDHYLEQKPSQAEAWFMRGEIRLALGKTDLARADYAEGFRRAPDANAEQILHWAQLVAALPSADPAGVLALVDDAIARIGPAPLLIDYAIEVEVGRANYEAALARVDRVMMQVGWPGKLLARRGDVLARAARGAEAVAAYQAALDAVEKLPAPKRAIADVQKVAHEARAAIERLSAGRQASTL